MATKSLLICVTVVLAWACVMQTTAAPVGWCYQCDSRDAYCQFDVDEVAMATSKVPCDGQCYTRIQEGRMSRGCSWEYGFMAKKPVFTPIFELGSMWIFCDTALCDARANIVQ